MTITGNIPVVVIGDTHVEENVQRKGKSIKRIIQTIVVPGHDLNSPVNTKKPEWLD